MHVSRECHHMGAESMLREHSSGEALGASFPTPIPGEQNPRSARRHPGKKKASQKQWNSSPHNYRVLPSLQGSALGSLLDFLLTFFLGN